MAAPASRTRPVRESISYADYAWALRRFGPEPASGEAHFLVATQTGARYEVVGALSDNEFLVRGSRTGALVLARIQEPRAPGTPYAGVVFYGLVDDGRDAQDIMLDVDRGNRWFGWASRDLVAQMRRRIRLRLLHDQ